MTMDAGGMPWERRSDGALRVTLVGPASRCRHTGEWEHAEVTVFVGAEPPEWAREYGRGVTWWIVRGSPFHSPIDLARGVSADVASAKKAAVDAAVQWLLDRMAG